MKILFVDDEKEILSSIRRQLRKEMYNIVTCNSGQEALDLLEKEEIPIIVSDERMPDMNGLKLMKRVKKLYPDSIRIILSGYADSQTVIEAINQGEIYRFIPKPWKQEELTLSIEGAIEKWKIVQHNKTFMKQIVDENKRLKMRLSYRESKLNLSQDVLNDIPSALIVVGRDDVIEVYNQKAHEVLDGLIHIGNKITSIIPEEIYFPLEKHFRDNGGSDKIIISLENTEYSIFIRGLRPTDDFKGIILIERAEENR